MKNLHWVYCAAAWLRYNQETLTSSNYFPLGGSVRFVLNKKHHLFSDGLPPWQRRKIFLQDGNIGLIYVETAPVLAPILDRRYQV